jgi:hypothetical protein
VDAGSGRHVADRELIKSSFHQEFEGTFQHGGPDPFASPPWPSAGAPGMHLFCHESTLTQVCLH